MDLEEFFLSTEEVIKEKLSAVKVKKSWLLLMVMVRCFLIAGLE
ncbi:hypothetical protein [Siminovitchia acidinfaciens]|nr:hypothetical protein [Siminovitchia acidinfaciens]